MSEHGEKLTVFGAGGHARSVIALLQSIQKEVVAVLDPAPRAGEHILGVPVYPCENAVLSDHSLVLAIGDNRERAAKLQQFASAVYRWPLIHASAEVHRCAQLGPASQCFAGCYIGPEVKLGQNNLINTRAILEHEVQIGDHNHLSVAAVLLGRVTIGSFCFIGAGAVIRDSVSICDGVTIGANAYVVKSVTEPGVYVGVPARKIS
ncbi:NeuD/PglB/VioB family sugar acetyltransferase [Rheinheimera aquimaris]|uniref:NeuD/PglB/VioB family sugar acetyltransferase n=1 Tax=Rheinheimera aquimaris TaxID=412437 RepID=UPI000E7F3456|nr:acetyltransferase [Rheinheimera sp.]|tara:strand:+ start:1973 stop:2590 length:618 start_codon:yes stop_codon:yes gene_type:complete